MYGTIFRMNVKDGEEQAVTNLFRDWENERLPKVDGAVATYLLKPEGKNGELVGVAVFENAEAFRSNANNPQQDEWFRNLRQHLEDDPEWIDGEYVAAASP